MTPMDSTAQQPLIKVRDLYKCYWIGDLPTPAINGVDLDIQAGEFAVLAGRSGSGKSTLLNIIGALESADAGLVMVAGEDILAMSEDQRTQFRMRNIGFVFQAYNLIQVLSAQENIAYVCQLQGMGRKRSLEIANHWLAEVEMADLGQRRPDQLSGGQQQRVAVARALATNPRIVLADEPTANLDTLTAQNLLCLLQSLNDKFDTTFLISSHDPDVKNASSRLIKLADGQVLKSWHDSPKPDRLTPHVCPMQKRSWLQRLRKLRTTQR
jgi:putative ABC transport system ATP-binding protein